MVIDLAEKRKRVPEEQANLIDGYLYMGESMYLGGRTGCRGTSPYAPFTTTRMFYDSAVLDYYLSRGAVMIEKAPSWKGAANVSLHIWDPFQELVDLEIGTHEMKESVTKVLQNFGYPEVRPENQKQYGHIFSCQTCWKENGEKVQHNMNLPQNKLPDLEQDIGHNPIASVLRVINLHIF